MCDAERASEESDLIPILSQDLSPWSRPYKDYAPEGLDGPARLRINWKELVKEAR